MNEQRNIKVLSGESVFTIIVLLFVVVLSGCQEEIINVVEPTEDQAVNSTSETAALVSSVARRDGSYDDIIDRASCLSLVFPVKVIVNGTQVTINSIVDLKTIEDILRASQVDEDKLEIQFPIIVIFPNHTQTTIGSKQGLDDIIAECARNGDADIECIDFLYPIKVTRYNSASQTADVVTIGDDKALFNFFGYLKEEDLAAFYFPITLVYSNGAEVTVSDISTLSKVIKDAIDDCDESDLYEDPNEIEFSGVLTSGEWIVTYFFQDKEDQTSNYVNFTFTFLPNGTFTSHNGSTEIHGDWTTQFDNDGIEFELDFENNDPPLGELDGKWIVIDFNNGKIRLKDSSGGNTTYLTFENP